MLTQFDEILADLELKRAASLPREERPAIDVSAAQRVHEASEPGHGD